MLTSTGRAPEDPSLRCVTELSLFELIQVETSSMVNADQDLTLKVERWRRIARTIHLYVGCLHKGVWVKGQCWDCYFSFSTLMIYQIGSRPI